MKTKRKRLPSNVLSKHNERWIDKHIDQYELWEISMILHKKYVVILNYVNSRLSNKMKKKQTKLDIKHFGSSFVKSVQESVGIPF